MLLAEVSDALQITMAVLSFLSVVMAPVIAILWAKARILNNQLEDEKAVKQSYKDITKEAVASSKEMANYVLKKDDKPPLLFVAPVVPESHSPSTVKQREAAEIATWRADMASLKLAVGQDPRAEPPHATAAQELAKGNKVTTPDDKVGTTISGTIEGVITEAKPKDGA